MDAVARERLDEHSQLLRFMHRREPTHSLTEAKQAATVAHRQHCCCSCDSQRPVRNALRLRMRAAQLTAVGAAGAAGNDGPLRGRTEPLQVFGIATAHCSYQAWLSLARSAYLERDGSILPGVGHVEQPLFEHFLPLPCQTRPAHSTRCAVVPMIDGPAQPLTSLAAQCAHAIVHSVRKHSPYSVVAAPSWTEAVASATCGCCV